MAELPPRRDGHAAVYALASALSGAARHRWLEIAAACYQTAERARGNRFAKRWVHGFQDARLNLKPLQRWGILEHVVSTRGGSRAYWNMPDRPGVATALKELGYL